MKWSDPIRSYPCGSTSKTTVLSKLAGEFPHGSEDHVDHNWKSSVHAVHHRHGSDKGRVFDVNHYEIEVIF